MSQPDWECIAQLGDVNPVDHGGYWIMRDKTGVYPEEAELFRPCEGDDGRVTAYRFMLKRCTCVKGILSDNQYHENVAAWWASDIEQIGMFVGDEDGDLVTFFCSEDPLERAEAYRALGDYHGFDNLDSDPLHMTRSEARRRYKEKRFQLVENPKQERSHARTTKTI